MAISWQDCQDPAGLSTREFRITSPGKRDVTGALWLPESPRAGSTLICLGHGASGDRYQAPLPYLARRFIQDAGLPVLSLDGPVHGLRQVGAGGRESFGPEWRRDDAVTDMTSDWQAAVAAIQALPEMGTGQLAYFGLSMGSIFGIPFVASRQDITVAVLGLLGITDGTPHGDEIMAAAARIDCPLLYLMQLEDELFSREGYLRVFDAFPSEDKRIHANPGLHPEIPAEEIDFAFDFLRGHISGKREKKIINPLAE